MTRTRTILMVSKPIAPPWSDSSKNLVRDLVRSGQRFRYRVLVPRGFDLGGEGVQSDPVYRGSGRFSPALLENMRVQWRLLRRDEACLTHFFFAPNPRSSAAVRLGLRLRPRLTVQTVCSTPRSFEQASRLLFGHRVIVLSHHTRERFEAAGIPSERLRVIPPGIRIPQAPSASERQATRRKLGLPTERPVIIYPGDLEVSGAALTVIRATASFSSSRPLVLMACRPKRPEAALHERRLRAELAHLGTGADVRFLGEVADMPELLSACDLCLLPADDLYAKMDYPLVLLEAMALAVPLVLCDRPPLSELLHDDIGVAIPPGDAPRLAAVVEGLLVDPERRLRLGENARRAACQRYDIAAVSRLHEDLYEDLMYRRGG